MTTTSTNPTPRDIAAELAERMVAYRAVREQVERAVGALATSVDGLTFELQTSLHALELRRGGYVELETDRGRRLGQVTDLRVETQRADTDGLEGVGGSVVVRIARGTGVLLDGDGSAFHDAVVRPADAGDVAAWAAGARSRRAGLTIGELLMAPGVEATLDSGGFARHTFMCGQSGSGKTYSLGLLLERVLAETTLPVVVLDPNSDYVRLGKVREGADRAHADRYAEVVDGISVWSNDPGADHALRLGFAELDPAAQAAVLGLDPVSDREEYAVLVDLLRMQQQGAPLVTDAEQLLHAETPAARALGVRGKNLGVLEWGVWSAELPSLLQELRAPTARCTVVDLGSLGSAQEQRVVAQAVLSTLWQTRMDRRPRLVVIDEAHNICPAEPGDPLTAQATETAVQIAAEGRKYGLYLLASTQRPKKVHENVVSQCDNLLLMRMNSHDDLAELSRLFSFVPSGLIDGASTFVMGQALVAGKLLPRPAYVQMGARVSEEGGADIPTAWAEPRGPV